MPIEDDLSDFFADSQRFNNVIKSPEKFRSQLQIGSDAFKYLSKAENIGNFTQIIGAGALAGTATSIVSTASLGVLGQIGLAVGVVSTPVGWIALAGAAGILTTYGAKRLFSSAKNEMVTEIPNFINTPLDVIGASICELILPILLKISYADDSFSENERSTIEDYFINKWGVDDLYIKKIIKDIETNIDSFSFDNLAAGLKEIESTGDCKFDTMSKEILSISNEVLMSDGASHKNEIIEIKKLEKALGAVNCETKFDKRIMIQSTKDLGAKAIDSVKTSGSWIQIHISKINQKK
jgi:tellurite resistance protein